jgi:hypothetical protein
MILYHAKAQRRKSFLSALAPLREGIENLLIISEEKVSPT